jgi:hypothetical protein
MVIRRVMVYWLKEGLWHTDKKGYVSLGRRRNMVY